MFVNNDKDEMFPLFAVCLFFGVTCSQGLLTAFSFFTKYSSYDFEGAKRSTFVISLNSENMEMHRKQTAGVR